MCALSKIVNVGDERLKHYFVYCKRCVTNYYRQEFPLEDNAAVEKMVHDGQFEFTEDESAFDAADALRFGRDIYVTLSNVC